VIQFYSLFYSEDNLSEETIILIAITRNHGNYILPGAVRGNTIIE